MSCDFAQSQIQPEQKKIHFSRAAPQLSKIWRLTYEAPPSVGDFDVVIAPLLIAPFPEYPEKSYYGGIKELVIDFHDDRQDVSVPKSILDQITCPMLSELLVTTN